MAQEKPTAFDARYAGTYDQFSHDAGKPYERSSVVMAARMREYAPDAKRVLELGSGTGNSGLVLLENIPSVDVIGVEKGDFIWLADAKRKGAVDTLLTPNQAPAYSKETEGRLQGHKDRFHLVKAEGENLPIRSGSMDVVFMCQVFHWLESEKALSEIHRVLKPGGIVVFDESETQFDFGTTEQAREIKAKHLWNHPFATLLQKNFSEELTKRGINLQAKPFAEPSTYLFNESSLNALLEKHGFELLLDTHGNPYTTTSLPLNHDRIIPSIEHGARMRLTPEMLLLFESTEQADAIVADSLAKTKAKWAGQGEGAPRTYGPTVAAFVARKKS